MNDDILRLEELSINAFPAILTEIYDGWLLRYSNGYTYRGNSINPLYGSKIKLEDKVLYCEEKYNQQNLPSVFKMTERADKHLDKLLASRGYQIQKKADMMNLVMNDKKYNGAVGVLLESALSEEWLDQFLTLNNTDEQSMKITAKTMLSHINNPVICASIYQDKKMIACGLGVLEDKHLGLYDIRVLQEYRRNKYGTKICESIIAESMKQGVNTVYLQVMSTNEVAIRMYQKLGFSKLYTYWYRVKNFNEQEKISD